MKNRLTTIVAIVLIGLLIVLVVPFFTNCRACGSPVQRIVVLQKSVLVAILAYQQEFGPLPSDSNADITHRLEGDNPRNIRFLEGGSDDRGTQGETLDPWGTPLKFYLSANRIVVRSAGPNKQFEDGNGRKTDDYFASAETQNQGTARQPTGDGKVSVPELFTKIETGMDRRSVESLLGKPGVPALSGGQATWYLPAPTLAARQSPYAPGSIGIVYDHNGKVTKKELNPQVQGSE